MIDDSTGRISLQPDEFFLLWFAKHKLRDFPYFFGINPVGRSRAERAECTAAASDKLAERGLGTIGDPAPGLLEVVDVLADTPARIEFTCTSADTVMWAVAAVRESRAAVAARTGTEIHLWVQDASNLVSSLIDNVPPMEPGKGTSASISVTDFEYAHEVCATDGTGAFQEALRDAGVHRTEIPTIMRTVERHHGGGTLAAKRRDDSGNWNPAPLRMSWVDTATGRYAIRQDDEWVTVTRADSARLNSIGGELLALHC